MLFESNEGTMPVARPAVVVGSSDSRRSETPRGRNRDAGRTGEDEAGQGDVQADLREAAACWRGEEAGLGEAGEQVGDRRSVPSHQDRQLEQGGRTHKNPAAQVKTIWTTKGQSRQTSSVEATKTRKFSAHLENRRHTGPYQLAGGGHSGRIEVVASAGRSDGGARRALWAATMSAVASEGLERALGGRRGRSACWRAVASCEARRKRSISE